MQKLLLTITLLSAVAYGQSKTPKPTLKDLLPKPEELPLETAQPKSKADVAANKAPAPVVNKSNLQFFTTCKNEAGVEYKQGEAGYQNCVDQTRLRQVETQNDAQMGPTDKKRKNEAPTTGVGATINFGK